MVTIMVDLMLNLFLISVKLHIIKNNHKISKEQGTKFSINKFMYLC